MKSRMILPKKRSSMIANCNLDSLALIVCTEDGGAELKCASSCSGCRNTVRFVLEAIAAVYPDKTAAELYQALVMNWSKEMQS